MERDRAERFGSNEGEAVFVIPKEILEKKPEDRTDRERALVEFVGRLNSGSH